MTNTRTKRIRRAVGLAAVAAGSLLVMASPASAANVYSIHPDWVDGCPGCPGPIEFKYLLVDPPDVYVEQPERIADKIAAATELLLEAARATPDLDLTKNPVASKAIAEFAVASDLAGHGTFEVADEIDGDWCGNSSVKPKPVPHGPYADAAELIAIGLTTLGQAAVDRDADAASVLQQTAAEAFGKAAVVLTSGG
jgi:hypothetical protein